MLALSSPCAERRLPTARGPLSDRRGPRRRRRRQSSEHRAAETLTGDDAE